LINQPHFAHSYQMFYRNFRTKAFGNSYPLALRLRYIFAGLVVPVALLAFIAIGVATALQTKSTQLLGYVQNLTILLVGWHYAKQGYGILIVDSVQKRLFFSEREKIALRLNAYACWILSWLGVNSTFGAMTTQWGIAYSALPAPAAVYYLAAAV